MRYFTVKTEAHGRTYPVHIAAKDADAAPTLALRQNSAAITAQVVREIDRAEFERLTAIPQERAMRFELNQFAVDDLRALLRQAELDDGYAERMREPHHWIGRVFAHLKDIVAQANATERTGR